MNRGSHNRNFPILLNLQKQQLCLRHNGRRPCRDAVHQDVERPPIGTTRAAILHTSRQQNASTLPLSRSSSTGNEAGMAMKRWTEDDVPDEELARRAQVVSRNSRTVGEKKIETARSTRAKVLFSLLGFTSKTRGAKGSVERILRPSRSQNTSTDFGAHANSIYMSMGGTDLICVAVGGGDTARRAQTSLRASRRIAIAAAGRARE
ncbi:hypothetical protein C8R45DRAFT_307870 [Mycena sanguinolenta]|nr:hypothetical protein C8R45DRAFT_307870 [Mycena sanguinolenta]